MSRPGILQTAGALTRDLAGQVYHLKTKWSETQRTVALREFRKAHPVATDEWAMVCPFNIGDIYLYSGLAGALRKYHGGSRVTFYTKPHQAFIPALFPSVTAAMPVPSSVELARLGHYILSPKPPHYGHFLQPPWNTLLMMGCRGTTFLDTMRGTLHLPWDAKLERPRPPDAGEIERATQLLISHGCRAGRSAIICPDATTTASMSQIPAKFWSMLVDGLHARGYDPVTNLGPATQVIPGSIGIKIPLDLFRATAVAGGLVMANRSGLCDLVSDLPMGLHAYYPAADWYGGRLIAVAGLRLMGLSVDALEYEIDPAGYRAVVDASLAQVPAK